MEEITETYLELNNVSTKVSTVGRNIGDIFDDNEDLVVIIPGNPGVNSFYDSFAREINKKLNCSVWCVGHAGHNLPNEKLQNVPNFKENKELYGLKGQLQNKVDFFEKYVPGNARIYLIGHSIGAYMGLDMLNNDYVSKKIDNAYFLFPTIENMASTDNGKFLTDYVKYIVGLTIFLSGLFHNLPHIIQTVLLYAYTVIVGIPKYNIYSIRQLIKPTILKRVFFLAYEEMDLVLERNNASIDNNIKKIKLLYGKTDGWVPLTYCDNIKRDFRDIDAHITSIRHAFVLISSQEVADIVCNWIINKGDRVH